MCGTSSRVIEGSGRSSDEVSGADEVVADCSASEVVCGGAQIYCSTRFGPPLGPSSVPLISPFGTYADRTDVPPMGPSGAEWSPGKWRHQAALPRR